MQLPAPLERPVRVNRRPYDLIVIGSGPAGEKGAGTAALLGKRVALIERDPYLGGASVNTGTVPSKTLRETALALSGLRARDLFGVDLSLRRAATIRDLMHHEGHVKRRERHRVWETLRLSNVEVFRGSGRFEGPHAVSVSNGSEEPVLLTGEKILIATGSSPVHPPGFEFEDPRVHDSDEILELDRVPASLAVVGAGVIGSEYACTFAALGVEVHLIDGRDRLLPFLDVDISNALEKAMRGLGVEFHWKEQVLECSTMDPDQVELACSSGRRFRLDGVLVAAGRKSNTASLNLEAAGIEPGPRGVIVVDSAFRTSVHHIYAAGDVIGFPALASTSSEQARFAMAHAFDPNLELTLAPLLPTGIYTIPEVSMVGETEASLKKQGVDYIAAVAPYSENSRGGIVGDRTGLLKLLFRRGDLKLLGVHAIGEQATELVHIGLMAMLTGQTAKIFVEACFNVPTLGDLYKQAALKAVMAEHLQPVAVA